MASIAGLASAILLVSTLIIGVFVLIFPTIKILATFCIILAVIGLATIIFATIIVLLEGSIVHEQLEQQLLDLPDLAEAGKADNSDKPRRKKLGIVR